MGYEHKFCGVHLVCYASPEYKYTNYFLSSTSLIFLFLFSACVYNFVLPSAAYLLCLLLSFLIWSNIFRYIMDLKVSDRYKHFIMSSALKLSFRVRPGFVTKDFLECNSDQETLQSGFILCCQLYT